MRPTVKGGPLRLCLLLHRTGVYLSMYVTHLARPQNTPPLNVSGFFSPISGAQMAALNLHRVWVVPFEVRRIHGNLADLSREA